MRCAAVVLLLAFFAFFHFLLSVCCLTKITRYMHSRNVCVFFSLSVYYDVVVGAVVMATACDAAATVAAAAVPMAAMFIGFVIFIFFLLR